MIILTLLISPLAMILSLLPQTSPSPISKSLPPLQLESYSYPQETFNDPNVHSFTYTFQETHSGQISLSPIQPLKSISHSCQFTASLVELELASSHPTAWQNNYGPLFYSQVYVPSKSLLYSVSLDLEITVYRYDLNGSLHQEATKQLQNQTKRYTQLRPHLVLSSDQEYLYVIVPMNFNIIWRISTSKLLSKIDTQILDKFDISKPVLRTISHNRHIYMVLDSEGLVVLRILSNGTLELEDVVTQVNDKVILPVSLALNPLDNLLFVLDSVENIYVFNVSGSIKIHDTISFSHPQNIQVQTFSNRVYCSFYDKQFAIMELVYDPRNKEAILIRYFTSTQYISNFEVTEDLLLVLSSRSLEIHPTNVDPRLIKKESGTHQAVKGDKIIAIQKDQYLLIGKNLFTIYKLQRTNPKIECRSSSETLSVNITYNGISKKCLHDFTSQPPFYHACNLTQTLQLQLPPLQPSNWFQIFLGILFLIFLLICVLYKLLRRHYEICSLNSQIDELQREVSAKGGEMIEIETDDKFRSQIDERNFTEVELRQDERDRSIMWRRANFHQ